MIDTVRGTLAVAVLQAAFFGGCTGGELPSSGTADVSPGAHQEAGTRDAGKPRPGKPDAAAGNHDASGAMKRTDGGTLDAQPIDASVDRIGHTLDGEACLLDFAPCDFSTTLRCCPSMECLGALGDSPTCGPANK
jgi:hypothetical protein